ncbi:chromosomal replication initiator protein DnaA [Jannaschia pagri]|uniref:Chromosomal replication initiator protein DnaA n=1 Tax=Jannaschia pagri TaxID=2829797 RepID=A0ABQ4NQF1_9RHOB|nr:MULTISPECIES: chromosomal replication initiator protein DnaA [unclassified Jannaschia]GIT92782.1 chromosomal replication initiator protein DnaA [Jannaschia sp. AI_61]GIT96617.1 chromosomal replication initiator protein DnaA [Jannaschia sp. AI_62]
MTDGTWAAAKRGISDEVGAHNYKAWIEPLTFQQIDDGTLHLGSPTDFIGKWVGQNFSEVILRHVSAAGDPVTRLLCSATPATAAAPRAQHAQVRSENALDKRFTFDSFVVGKSNELAHAAARRVATGDSVSFNPLFLHGGVGLGKTHLMQAIAWELAESRPECRVMFLSAEQFMYRFVQALREKNTMDFKHLFRTVDVLLVDDVQFIAGKESTQEEFFHTFNALVDQGKQVVISADRSPAQISDLEERITSRLQSGLVVDLHPADYELRLGVLQQRVDSFSARHPNFEVADGVLEFLAGRISTSIRVLEGAVTRLFAYADLIQRRVTLDEAQDVLADLLRQSERKLTIDEIMKKTCEHYNLRMSDMTSARRSRSVARPRQMAMYLSKKLTPRSYPEIGRKFGGKDHTTVLYAVRKIEELIAAEPQIAEDAELLQRKLES